MHAVMHVPSRRRLGDAPSKDLDQVRSVKEFVDAPYTKDEAVRFYQWAILMRSVQQKSRFFAFLVKDIIGNPGVFSIVRETPYLSDFVVGSDGVVNFSANLQSTPNLMTSVANAITALETVVLPAAGLSVSGYMPNFNEPRKTLDRVKVGPINPSLESLPIGDLFASTLLDDLHALNVLGKQLAGPQGAFLGSPIAGWVIALIVIGAVTLGTVVISQAAIVPVITAKEDAIKRAIEALEKSPNVSSLLQSMGPEAVKQFMDRLSGGASLMGEFVDVLKWGAIGLGVLTVGGTVLYFMHR